MIIKLNLTRDITINYMVHPMYIMVFYGVLLFYVIKDTPENRMHAGHLDLHFLALELTFHFR